jgi:hypothetical protein
MNVSKFLLLLFILIAMASHVAQSTTVGALIWGKSANAIANSKGTIVFLASMVLSYIFLVYVVYKVKFHDDDEE